MGGEGVGLYLFSFYRLTCVCVRERDRQTEKDTETERGELKRRHRLASKTKILWKKTASLRASSRCPINIFTKETLLLFYFGLAWFAF